MKHTDLPLTCWKLTHPLQDPVLPSAVHQLLSLTSNAAMHADHPCKLCHKLTCHYSLMLKSKEQNATLLISTFPSMFFIATADITPHKQDQ